MRATRMKEFLKPTKAKIFITLFLLACVSVFSSVLFAPYDLFLPTHCIPPSPNEQIATPIPFSITQTMNDFRYPPPFCFTNDPSAQAAYTIIYLTKLGMVMLIILTCYLLACESVFINAKKQKKQHDIKLKK